MLKKIFYRILSVLIVKLGKAKNLIPGTLNSANQKNLKIGKNVSFGGNVFLYPNATITIGDSTMIAYGVIIHTSTHDYSCHPMYEKRIDLPVKIGNNVWIGAGAIILPGVIIEDYAVIGAGCVVTKNVPEGAIVVGNPPRIIKNRDPKIYKDKCPSILDPNDATIILGNYLEVYFEKE